MVKLQLGNVEVVARRSIVESLGEISQPYLRLLEPQQKCKTKGGNYKNEYFEITRVLRNERQPVMQGGNDANV